MHVSCILLSKQCLTICLATYFILYHLKLFVFKESFIIKLNCIKLFAFNNKQSVTASHIPSFYNLWQSAAAAWICGSFTHYYGSFFMLNNNEDHDDDDDDRNRDDNNVRPRFTCHNFPHFQLIFHCCCCSCHCFSFFFCIIFYLPRMFFCKIFI